MSEIRGPRTGGRRRRTGSYVEAAGGRRSRCFAAICVRSRGIHEACGLKESADRGPVLDVPYLVNPRSSDPDIGLWSDAERSAKAPQHRVASGTRVRVIDKKELPRSRGKTMHLVETKDGRKGWVPEFCIEYREK